MGFPGSSAGKESTCSVGDPCLMPELGRSAGEGLGYPLQYSWASLMAQMVKNPPTMQETRVQSLGWEDTLEKGMVTHSSILAWRIPWTEEPGGLQFMGLQIVRHYLGTRQQLCAKCFVRGKETLKWCLYSSNLQFSWRQRMQIHKHLYIYNI